MKDYLFVETFLYQVLIFIDCLTNPIKDQESKFKVTDQEAKALKFIIQRIHSLIKISDKVNSEGNKRIYDKNRDKIINLARFQ